MGLLGNAGEAEALPLPKHCRLRRRHLSSAGAAGRAALCVVSPQGSTRETLGGLLLPLGAATLVQSHGFQSAETKYSKYFPPAAIVLSFTEKTMKSVTFPDHFKGNSDLCMQT